MIWNKKMLLLRLRSMAIWAQQAGYSDTLGYELRKVLKHFEHEWKIDVTTKR